MDHFSVIRCSTDSVRAAWICWVWARWLPTPERHAWAPPWNHHTDLFGRVHLILPVLTPDSASYLVDGCLFSLYYFLFFFLILNSSHYYLFEWKNKILPNHLHMDPNLFMTSFPFVFSYHSFKRGIRYPTTIYILVFSFEIPLLGLNIYRITLRSLLFTLSSLFYFTLFLLECIFYIFLFFFSLIFFTRKKIILFLCIYYSSRFIYIYYLLWQLIYLWHFIWLIKFFIILN